MNLLLHEKKSDEVLYVFKKSISNIFLLLSFHLLFFLFLPIYSFFGDEYSIHFVFNVIQKYFFKAINK